MFNPLNFFKKTSPALESEDKVARPPAEVKVQMKNVAFHSMPERFRNNQPIKTEKAKKAGGFIMTVGLALLVVMAGLFYFFVLRKPEVVVKKEEAPVAENENQVEAGPVITEPEQIATTTATSTLTLIPPGEEEIATSTATSTPETIENELSVGLIPSLDSDSDGLTDAEEIIFNTSTSTPDTDADGYADGAEVLSLYDPTASSSRLSLNPAIASYENKTFGYSILYPESFTMSLNGGEDSIMLTTSDNQIFQIIVQANTSAESLDDWYKYQLGVENINDLNRVSTNGLPGIKNLDGLSVYIISPKSDYIFTLAYNPGENNILDYINIFNMIIKSFKLK